MIRERARIVVRGAVQGVGFRPFVYRLATDLQLDGWVLNSAQGVFIEVEGSRDALNRFIQRLEMEKPARAVIQSSEVSFLDPVGHGTFEIRQSEERGVKTVLILPDIAPCADCLREIRDPADRHYRYPFTNCTNCGPRFSIIEALPYDRAATSMKNFIMCADCRREYEDPRDRRFHAQPNACPRCGPQLELWNAVGEVLASEEGAIRRAVEAVEAGQILGLKGLGGFQLIVDAANEAGILRLRARKHREEKPFALMAPSLASVREFCFVSDLEERLLLSPEAPIVILRRLEGGAPATPGVAGSPELAPPLTAQSTIAAAVAPRNPNLGVMLPSTLLHHLLLGMLGKTVVATSGNLSDEPICIDEREALDGLGSIADLFLVHNRPIVRHMDDSIARIMAGREMMLRRARGYAPLPVTIKSKPRDGESEIVLALGAHLKNTVALRVGKNVFLSQHIGDLATEKAYAAFVRSAVDLPRLYDVAPQLVACDMHPDYLSTKYAMEGGAPAPPHSPNIADSRELAPATRWEVRTVQHHWAHVAACMAENELESPALGVAWDGTGYGLDGTIWGGEFLLADGESFRRVAHFRQFPLPGGEAAVKEPRRCAIGLLSEVFGAELWERAAWHFDFNEKERSLLRQMLEKKINSPVTSSVGRLFDAVAGLIGLRTRATFEGQAAMELEFAAELESGETYSFELREGSPTVVDWKPSILEMANDLERGDSRGSISAKFHNMLTEITVQVARKFGEPKIVLTGGCFQNRRLLERTIGRLREEGFRPYWHQRVPPNDGGIALGQAVAANSR
jgi:hydrogenase maturation protein HypF